MKKISVDRFIAYLVNDMSIPYWPRQRVRVHGPSPELKAFIVPRLGVQRSDAPSPEVPQDRASGLWLKTA
jgi:hypothetical protein